MVVGGAKRGHPFRCFENVLAELSRSKRGCHGSGRPYIYFFERLR